MYNNKNSKNKHITTMKSEYSCMVMSYFREFLTLKFNPRIDDEHGFPKYNMGTYLSTTFDIDGARYFYQIAKPIIDGSAADKPERTIIPCKRDAELIFEYKPESDGQMRAFLTINKDNLSIPFLFSIHQYDQQGLATFTKVLYGYLEKWEATQGLEKLPDFEPKIHNDADSLGNDDIAVNNIITISWRLSRDEAIVLKRDFGMYKTKCDYDWSMTRRFISHPAKKVFRNWNTVRTINNFMYASMEGDYFTECNGIDWAIKEYKVVHKGEHHMYYFVDIIIDIESAGDDRHSLKSLINYVAKKSGKISPLLSDLSDYELLDVNYQCQLFLDPNEIEYSTEKMEELINKSNINADRSYYMPAKYHECEIYCGNGGGMEAYVSVDCFTKGPYLYFDIIRSFSKYWNLTELLEKNSDITKLVIEQILSNDYAKKSAAIYLNTSVMGGNYYSMKKAMEIIKSADLSQLQDLEPVKKESLTDALIIVAKHNNIFEAKLSVKNDHRKLHGLTRNLDRLVKLGINPVTIPESYNMTELSNPALRIVQFCTQGDEDKSIPSCIKRIEVDETIGALPIILTVWERKEKSNDRK